MLFSSPVFLFGFLPLVLVAYTLSPRRARNGLLLVASLLFYAWGEKEYALLVLGSVGVNYVFGLLLERPPRGSRQARTLLALAIVANLLPLAFFKYTGFLIANLNAVLPATWHLEVPPVHLPIGISFFTFQALSYVVDVYRREGAVQRSYTDLCLYVVLFPQLIAGPIVRYRDIAAQLAKRRVTLVDFDAGARRFIVGLGKKVLIANHVGGFADWCFSRPPGELPTLFAWLGLVCYTLQIYFDFSGYSDMAIGLGRMFGFRFLENFNYPYVARSVREFWRRWHISLSTWLRDYLYVPLGGNRVSPARVYLNQLIVFVLCGLWHGASWTFVAWGLFHGSFLVLERTRVGTLVDRLPRILQHAYVLLVVSLAWVFFRAESLPHAIAYFATLFGAGAEHVPDPYFLNELNFRLYAVLALGVFGATPLAARARSGLEALEARLPAWLAGKVALAAQIALGAGYLGVLAWSAAHLLSETYNPFIYFQF